MNVATSIGVPAYSIEADAAIYRPRSTARGKSMRGNMAGNRRARASTSSSAQDGDAFLLRPRPTAHDQVAHLFFSVAPIQSRP